MNTKTVCAVIFVLACSLHLGIAIKCYRCNTVTSCHSPALYDCSASYADETVTYLDTYYRNVTKVPSNSFHCIRHDMYLSSVGNLSYKGCAYSTMDSCSYSLKLQYQVQSSNTNCKQCNNYDGCNPADRSSVSVLALALPLMFAAIFKHFV